MYLVCGHCHCEFLASAKQLKRSRTTRAREMNVRFCCSRACQAALMSKDKTGKYKNPRHQGVCALCGTAFESRYPKKFCTLKCYNQSPEFKAMMAENRAKQREHVYHVQGQEVPGTVIEKTCLHCGITWKVPGLKKYIIRKFCSHRCYRGYMNGRFDRWLASPQSIALPQNYDEFMLQEELPCLIEGCDWVGHALANHVNFAHGIPAEEFKRAAGFNLKTGLVSPEMAEALRGREHIHSAFPVRPMGKEKGPPLIRNYRSLEGREHWEKARALAVETAAPLPPRICRSCGQSFTPDYGSFSQRFCTLECRKNYYARTAKATRFELICSVCDQLFPGTLAQSKRQKEGQPVCCSMHCRALHNAPRQHQSESPVVSQVP
jgi:hypothetical protein